MTIFTLGFKNGRNSFVRGFVCGGLAAVVVVCVVGNFAKRASHPVGVIDYTQVVLTPGDDGKPIAVPAALKPLGELGRYVAEHEAAADIRVDAVRQHAEDLAVNRQFNPVPLNPRPAPPDGRVWTAVSIAPDDSPADIGNKLAKLEPDNAGLIYTRITHYENTGHTSISYFQVRDIAYVGGAISFRSSISHERLPIDCGHTLIAQERRQKNLFEIERRLFDCNERRFGAIVGVIADNGDVITVGVKVLPILKATWAAWRVAAAFKSGDRGLRFPARCVVDMAWSLEANIQRAMFDLATR